ncbi:HEPN domain-containing protein [Alteromonas sp. 76-1]|uniref:HEPN domain-containing protein n=1 Tax=Alteromonas sp. 76-1 TaxID=2358187 RepID=UPI000FD167A9|nr:HEPN domain-containing protein [Alteromonas sp. 76-1]VEL95980.1 HEPN domain-containing protein [Alteromonas sp. 76-1]
MDTWRIEMTASKAIEHYRAAYHCSRENGFMFSSSELMLATFSAELAMKALIYKSGQKFKKHRLKELLHKLKPSFRNEIEEVLRNEWSDYDIQLSNADNSFVTWRYIFEEEKPTEVNHNFVMRLAELCCIIVKREFQIEEYIGENGKRRINSLPSIKK